MPTKRAVFSEVPRHMLHDRLDYYWLEVYDWRVRSQFVDALAGSRKTRLDAMLRGLSRNPEQLRHAFIADQRKRWGGCDRSGTIRLHWRIIQARCASSTTSSSTNSRTYGTVGDGRDF